MNVIQRTQRVSMNACSTCRKLHRKCDRKLPACTLCIKTKRQCCYNIVKKRGFKSKEEKNPSYPTLTSTFSFHKIITLHDENFSSTQVDIPVQKMSIDSSWLYGNESPPNIVSLALIYAFDACTLRTSDSNLSKLMFEKSKTLAMSTFDCVLQDFALAVCFIILGAYCTLEDDMDRSSFFLDNVKKFIDKNNSENPGIMFLQALYDHIEQFINFDIDMESCIKRAIVEHHSAQEYLNSINTPAVMSSKFLNLLSTSDIVGGDIAQIRADFKSGANTYILDDEKLDMISSKMYHYSDHLSGTMPHGLHQLQKIDTMRICYGAQLQRFSRKNDMVMAHRVAQNIARMGTIAIFEKFSIIFGSVMILAADAHIHYLNSIRNDQNLRSNILDCMTLEFNALQIIQQKNQVARVKCEPIVQKLAHYLRSGRESIILYPLPQHSVPVDTSYMLYDVDRRLEEEEEEALFNQVDLFFQDFIN
jgi:hypothetical protein